MTFGRSNCRSRWNLNPLSSPSRGQGLTLIHVSLFLVRFLPNAVGQAADGGLDQSKPPVGSGINLPIALLIMFLLFAFFVLTFISLFFKPRRNETQLRPAVGAVITREARRTARGLDPEVIESFPTFLYSEVKELKIGKYALECAVCLNEFEDGEMLRMMPPCSHVFHPDCIDVWLFSHSTCPVCRTNLAIVPKPDESVPGSAEPEIEAPAATAAGAGDTSVSECPDARLLDSVTWTNRNRAPRSRSTGVSSWGIKRLFPRSHSTGHSLVQPGDNTERFTLRLPEEVRRRVMMNRRLSQTGFGQARSSRRGYRSGSVGATASQGQERFGHRRASSVAIPFGTGTRTILESGSVRSTNGNGEMGRGHPKGLLGSIKDRLFVGKDETGERSSDWLRRNSQV